MNQDRREADEPRGIEALNDVLDELALGRGPTTAAGDGLDETIRRLNAVDDSPAPDARYVKRLEAALLEDALMSSARSRLAVVPTTPTAPNGRATVPPHSGRERAAATGRRWWPAVELAAVAAIIVALLGSYFGWSRIFPDDPASRLPQGAATPTTLTGGDTAMFLGDAGRTGVAPGPGPEGDPGLRWRVGIENMIEGAPSPVVANGIVYVTQRPGGLLAVDAATGQTLFESGEEAASDSVPAIVNGVLYAMTIELNDSGPNEGILVAKDAVTGQTRWRYRTGGTVATSPAVVAGTVYVRTSDGTGQDDKLHAVDAETGSEKWRLTIVRDGPETTAVAGGERPRFAGWVGSSPVVADGLVYVTTSTGMLVAVDAESGDERWRLAKDDGGYLSAAVSDGTIYVATVNLPEDRTVDGGHVLALDARSGTERWAQDVADMPASSPAVADGMVYLTGYGPDRNGVAAFAAETGERQWVFEADGAIVSSPTVADGIIYLTSRDAGIYAIDATDGTLRWRVEMGAASSSTPAVVDGVVFVTDGNDSLYAIGGATVDAGTPAAVPAADGDISGLAPCTADPRPESADPPLEGTPAASLAPIRDGQPDGQAAQILESEIPAGEPASDETVAAIEQARMEMVACNRPGRERELLSFYSDDYYRRVWVASSFSPDYPNFWGAPSSEGDPRFDDVRLLPDGRVAVVIRYPDVGGAYGQVVVYVEQDGRWLIDEWMFLVERLGQFG